jgi:hypothetical protein
MDIELRAEHLTGVKNELANLLSREFDRGSWVVAKQIFNKLNAFNKQLYGHHFTIDRTADSENTQLPRYNSKYHDPGTEAVDTFTQNWAMGVKGLREFNYSNPDFKDIGRMLKHAKQCRAVACLIVPEWRAQWWWPVLLSDAVHWCELPHSKELFRPRAHGNHTVGPPPWGRTWAVWLDYASVN